MTDVAYTATVLLIGLFTGALTAILIWPLR